MSLTNDEKQALRDQTFELDCPSLAIYPMREQPITRGSQRHEGAGQIACGKDGYFEIKLYPRDPVAPSFGQDRFRLLPGELIGDDYQYRIEAIDLSGRKWEGVGILPGADGGAGGTLIRGRVRRLSSTSVGAIDVAGHALTISYPAKVEVPLNQYRHTEHRIAEDWAGSEMRLSVARASACDRHFQVEERPGETQLWVGSETVPFDEAALGFVLDAFMFMSANDCPWCSIEIMHGTVVETRIQTSVIEERRSRIGPPAPVNHLEEAPWELFAKYLAYCLRESPNAASELGETVRAIIAGGRSSIDVEALVLSVTIESLLVGRFCGLVSGQTPSNTEIASTLALLDAAGGLTDSMRARLKGFVGAMGTLRAKDVLVRFRERGLIRPKLIELYTKLRNEAAHGEGTNAAELQPFLDRCAAALTLFYQLVFLLVGYTGKYSDYSLRGWPTPTFSVSLVAPPVAVEAPSHSAADSTESTGGGTTG